MMFTPLLYEVLLLLLLHYVLAADSTFYEGRFKPVLCLSQCGFALAGQLFGQ
jgi:hypothetical protein